MPSNYQAKRQQLDRDGFCLLEGIIDETMLAQLRTVTDRAIARQEAAHFERNRAQGSLIRVTEEPFMARLIAYPPMLAALARLGFPAPQMGQRLHHQQAAGEPAPLLASRRALLERSHQLHAARDSMFPDDLSGGYDAA